MSRADWYRFQTRLLMRRYRVVLSPLTESEQRLMDGNR